MHWRCIAAARTRPGRARWTKTEEPAQRPAWLLRPDRKPSTLADPRENWRIGLIGAAWTKTRLLIRRQARRRGGAVLHRAVPMQVCSALIGMALARSPQEQSRPSSRRRGRYWCGSSHDVGGLSWRRALRQPDTSSHVSGLSREYLRTRRRVTTQRTRRALVAKLEHPVLAAFRQSPVTEAQVRRAVTEARSGVRQLSPPPKSGHAFLEPSTWPLLVRSGHRVTVTRIGVRQRGAVVCTSLLHSLCRVVRLRDG